MDIEELAFKDRKTLAQLNEKDLLDIIVFLQSDRKLWINQFSKTHNESVDIRKENQELKKQLEEWKHHLKCSKEMLDIQGQKGNYDYDDFPNKLQTNKKFDVFTYTLPGHEKLIVNYKNIKG